MGVTVLLFMSSCITKAEFKRNISNKTNAMLKKISSELLRTDHSDFSPGPTYEPDACIDIGTLDTLLSTIMDNYAEKFIDQWKISSHRQVLFDSEEWLLDDT